MLFVAHAEKKFWVGKSDRLLEAGSFATSYIPTGASQVTRAADVALISGANFSSFYRQDEGTFVLEYITGSQYPNAIAFIAGDAGPTNAIYVDNNTVTRAVVFSGGSAVAVMTADAVTTAGTTKKLAFCYKGNDFAVSSGGAAVVTHSAGAAPVGITQLYLGSHPNGASAAILCGHIKRLRFYPFHTRPQIQALATP